MGLIQADDYCVNDISALHLCVQLIQSTNESCFDLIYRFVWIWKLIIVVIKKNGLMKQVRAFEILFATFLMSLRG